MKSLSDGHGLPNPLNRIFLPGAPAFDNIAILLLAIFLLAPN